MHNAEHDQPKNCHAHNLPETAWLCTIFQTRATICPNQSYSIHHATLINSSQFTAIRISGDEFVGDRLRNKFSSEQTDVMQTVTPYDPPVTENPAEFRI